MYLGVGGTLRDRIPEATVARLPVYLRCLVDMSERGTHRVSSDQLAEAAGVNSAKVRKDLSYLGSYGTRGVGYDVEYLIYQVRRELGLEQDWSVAIVGVGKVGEQVGELTVDHIDDLDRVVKEEQVAIGIIATPATAAQEVCDRLVAAGVTSILNFAPAQVHVPAGVFLRKVDLSTELQILSFHEQRRAAVDLVRQVAARNRGMDADPGQEARD